MVLRPSKSLYGVLAAFVLALLSPPAAGQIPEEIGEDSPEINRPASIGRIARHFDFEERSFNAFDVPLYWIRAQHDPEVRQRPGFPITNLGHLDYAAPATSGFGSIRLDTVGGSTSLRLEPGVVPVFPSVQYAVGVMVRVDGLESARPRLAARLLDEEGQPIAGASASQVIEPPIDGGWSDGYMPVLLKMPAAPDNAVSVQIDLELVQQQQINNEQHAEYALWKEDYSGSVWFDDVVVVQLPTATLQTSRASNAFLAGESPELLATIRDLSGDPMNVDLFVRDLDGTIVAQRHEEFGMGTRELRWQPTLPALGWYEAELVVSVGQTPMLRLHESFVWLPRSQPSMSAAATMDNMAPDRQAIIALADRRRLGVTLPSGKNEIVPDLAGELLDRSGARAMVVPVEVSAGTPDDPAALSSRWADLAEQITSMQTRLGAQASIMLTVSESAGDTGHTSPGDHAFAVLETSEVWDNTLVGLIDRLAEGVSRWHVGPLGTDALAGTPTNAKRLATIASRIDRLAPDPRVGVPWPGQFDPAQVPLPATERRWGLTAQAPPDASGEWVAEVADRMNSMLERGDIAEGTLVLQPLDPSVYGRRAAVGALCEQVLAFWDALPTPEIPSGLEYPLAPLRLILDDAWDLDEQHEARGPDLAATLSAWRGLGDRLVGLRRIYEFETIEGVRATIYEPILPRTDGSGGLLVLRPAEGLRSQRFELYLGEDPVRVIDAFGNASTLEPVEVPEEFVPTPRLVHRIELGDLPVFVENIDTDLLMFIASLRLEPELLPAIDIEHPAALVMRNPWPGVTSVRARVVSPGGFAGQAVSERSWEIAPRLMDLLLEGGQERRTPLNIRFKRSEPAGRKSLGLEIDLRGENSARRIRVDVPFRIGLDYLDVTATARRAEGGVLVTAEVRNLGQRPVTLETTAIAPGVGRQRAIIPQLAPGATARRELLLRGASLTSGAERIILAIEDVDVGARLNYQVDVP